jgi:hypothetical protein
LEEDQTNSNANLLKDIRAIYFNKLKQFHAYPDTIITEVLSKISRNEPLVQKFENEFYEFSRRAKKECSLVPVENHLPIRDESKQLYNFNKGKLRDVWISHSTPHALLVFRKGLESYQCMFFNYEKCEILDGIIEKPLYEEHESELVPFFNKNPQSDFTDIKQFDGGIIYHRELNKTNTNEFGLFKRSFKDDNDQLIKKYGYDCCNFFYHKS